MSRLAPVRHEPAGTGFHLTAAPVTVLVPKPLALALKLVATPVAVWLVWRRIDFDALHPVLLRADFLWVIACVAIQYVIVTLNASRWRLLFPVPGTPLFKYVYYVLVGHFLTLFLPSAALAEGARTYAFGKKYGGMQKNFVAMVLARSVGMIVQAVLAGGCILVAWDDFARLDLWSGMSVVPVAWAVVAGGGLLAGLAGWFFRRRLASIWKDLRAYLARPGLLLRVTWSSLLIQVFTAVSMYTLFKAVGWDIRLWQVVLIPALVQIGLLLPVTLGGVGVREYLNIVLYGSLAGIPAETILAATILGYIPVLLVSGSGGAWMALRSARTRENS